MWRALKSRTGSDRGAVIILTALVLPVCILFAGFVVDVANWFEHKRHLQTQADAAALAGAGSFLRCPDNAPIIAKAEEYHGETWNPQVGEAQDSVHMEINSATYPLQPDGPTDSTVVEEPPCEAGMVDVKLTETDLPWWFDITQDVDFINAHARAEFFEVDSLAGAIPFGVPDVKPETVRVWFIDEDTGLPLTTTSNTEATQLLTRDAYAGGIARWNNLDPDEAPEVTLPAGGPSKIGVRVALSGGTSTNCADPGVECYDAGNVNGGILYARAWARDLATPTAPKARHVGLMSVGVNGCSEDFPYFIDAPAAGCDIGVDAVLDFGAGAVPTDYTVTATVGNKKYTVQYNAAIGRWQSNAPIPIDPATGPVPIGLEWKKGKDSGSFGIVQRAFSASLARSGPIKEALLSADGAVGVSSLEQCSASWPDCTYKLTVQLGIQGSFEDIYDDLQNVTEPVKLRFAGGDSGSQNQALDCDPWSESNADPDLKLPNGTRSFVGEIALGCRPAYTRNQGTACPASPNTLWGASTSRSNQGPAWPCVAVETGDRVNQVATGLNLRIFRTKNPAECTHPNNWDVVKHAPEDHDHDPRVVHLFLTQFGVFDQNQGQNTVPVTNFATFYVTGWRGQGGQTGPCVNPPAPIPADDPVSESGTVVGHWMKYRGSLGDSHGTRPCDPNSPTPCVFALTE